MNNEDKVIAALSKKGGEPQTVDPNKGQGESEELKKAQHTADMWGGRAKQLSQEKAALAQENAELKERIRKLEAGSEGKAFVEKLTPEQLGDLPKDYATTMAGVSAELIKASEEKHEAELAQLRAEMKEGNRRLFLSQIGAQHDKFFDLVSPGGANAGLWEQFKANNQETFEAIMETQDSARFDRFVADFCRVIGIAEPSGATAKTTTPDPVTTGGGKPVSQDDDSKKVYTPEEYDALEKRAMQLRATDYKEYLKLRDELENILVEGRIKEQ